MGGCMNKTSEINKTAWESGAYDFWIDHFGSPEEHAKLLLDDPKKRLKKHYKYFKDVKDLKIANICGSNGRRAICLALLGADASVFDISEENKRYGLELAKACHVNLTYVLGDVYDIDTQEHGNGYDALYLEGGILHLFHDIDRLMKVLYSLLKPNGFIVLNDFHPFRKVMKINFFDDSIKDYFDTNIHAGDVAFKSFVEDSKKKDIPDCSYRYYNISEILNSMIKVGFNIKEFNEDPSWTDETLPGEITIHAIK